MMLLTFQFPKYEIEMPVVYHYRELQELCYYKRKLLSVSNLYNES